MVVRAGYARHLADTPRDQVFFGSLGVTILPMDDKLKNLISGAKTRLKNVEAERTKAMAQRDDEMAAKDRAKFYAAIQSGLGPDVLASLGPLTYRDDFLTNAMHFAVNGRSFKVQQVTGTLANLEIPTGSGRMLAQFQLQNPDAKDLFLEALGKELSKSELG